MATITNRELKNKTTSIDILVPDYEEIQGTLSNTVIYHVIVITKLFYFKKSSMKESDVVQFMVPHKYNEFEDLYHKISQRFPSVVFIPLPKKPLVMSESVIHERRHAMESVFQVICKTPKLCSSPALLEFLGVKSAQVKAAQAAYNEESPGEEQSSPEIKAPMAQMEEDDDSDLFTIEQDSKLGDDDLLSSAPNTSSSKPAKTSLFDEQEDTVRGVFKDDDLFIPHEAKVEEKKGHSEIFDLEDESDLLNIEDDLDKLLQVNKSSEQPKPKPRKKTKPDLKPKPSPRGVMFEESNDGMDELFAMTSPEKPVKPAKPAALRPKPTSHAPKPAALAPKPKPRLSSNNEIDELFAGFKKSHSKTKNAPEELETLDDIFGDLSDDSPTRPVFTGLDGDDDLFKPIKPSVPSEDLSTDDISQYIQQNLEQEEVSLDL